MQAGLVFNIQECPTQGGHRIRTAVLLNGCPRSCAWCRNPECQSATREIVVVETRCIKCGKCVLACPAGGTGQVLSTNIEGCLSCGKCMEACPTGARQFAGQRMTVSGVMTKILEHRSSHKDSYEGVTFSGGEPLSQPIFLYALVQACRQREIQTWVDTCGYGSTDRLLAIAPFVDLFIYSLSSFTDSNHPHHCGISNDLILENLKQLDEVHQNIWVRIPLTAGGAEFEDGLRRIAVFVAGLKHVTQVELVPYGGTGSPGYERFAADDALNSVNVPPVAAMDRAARIFRDYGREIRLRS